MNKTYLRAIHQIIVTGHWITDQVGIALKEYSITEPQFNVLRILKGRKGKPITVIKIQEQMVQRSSNVTRIIDKLINKGLVDRHECPTNRRKMDITMTEKGVEFLKVLDKKVLELHQPMYNNLSERELEQLFELVKKLKTGTRS